ncbi:hypothetical protein PTSG_05134 [Salpingoeca rosetta]|uniref:Uncharacterized protein n=1 Tax=Salpingoeca rosetta (strain ATCC 50818 / BSB-021) TaxID=946362 RepID=F2UAL5_SALR5|nr:uncharacterized protein PTSG_05134 [Salpingoeca rosetta]EGD73431.1 hypothetical protein PTSG_05134 [Salpingoeca rosetta]|eukprot:XP_004993713.1 hypothetical protein PTSG_05134 [Salpingoeca rosetta]
MSYFDIDDILMQEERLPCVASIDVIKMGSLDPSSATPYLRKGSKVDLPLWLIKSYREKNGEDIFEVDPPKFLGPKYLDMLRADATVINLQSWCSHFFSFAITYLTLFQDGDLATTIQDSFGHRYLVILDISQNAVQDDTSEKTRNLDQLERQLFHAGLQDDRAQQQWRRRQAHRILPWAGAPRRDAFELGHLTKRPKLSFS